MSNVCKDCDHRHQGCHSECEEYLAEHAARMKEYEARAERVKVTSASIDLRERRGRKK